MKEVPDKVTGIYLIHKDCGRQHVLTRVTVQMVARGARNGIWMSIF